MALTSPSEGELLLLAYMFNKTAPDDPVIKLYGNDAAITGATVRADLTEASEAGYAAITLAGAGWTITSPGGVTTAEFAASTFTFTTSASIFGYFVTDQTNDDVLWVERFSGAPFALPGGGGTIAITPKITLE